MSREELRRKIIEAVESDPNKDCIKSISLFGSHLHKNARPKNDIDLLVELRKRIGFFTLAKMQFNLEKHLGLEVDLVEKNSLSKYIKPKVLKEAERIYERR